MSANTVFVVVLSGALIVAGCGERSETTSTTTTQATAAVTETASQAAVAPPVATPQQPAAVPAAAPRTQAAVIATGEYSADPNLRAELLEVRRVSGGALLVKWRVVNASPDKPVYYDFAWTDLYYVDPAENKKYSYLTDTENNKIIDVFYGTLKAGEQRSNWAKFPAPPPTSTKISISLPKFAPFEDVPVS